MKTKRSSMGRLSWAIAGASVLLMSASALPEAGPPGKAETGIILEYRMAEGRVLQYQRKSETKEVADVMGQTIEAETKETSVFSFRPKGRKENNHLIEVTVNDMETSISSVQGGLTPDLSPVKGKSFDMVLSPLGVEVDVSGAETITFEAGGSTRNISSGFKIFFPDLPGKPVKVGDTWPASFTVEDKSSATAVTISVQSVETLEGFETVEGLECARISSKYTGTISGTGKQQGADLTFSGTLKGKDVWHFAVKEGIYVQSTMDSVREISVAVSGPQDLTIPSTQTSTGTVKLIAR